GIVLESGDAGVEQAVIGLAAGDDDVALVQLQAHHAVHVFLGGVDHGLQHLPLRAPPVAVVDQAGVARHQLVLQVGHFAVQGDGLDGAVGLEHDGAAGGFVAAAGLHAHVAVLHDVQATDAVGAADLVEPGEHGGRAHLDAVDGDDVALAVGQLDVGRGVGGLLRGDGPAPHVFLVLGPGVFQHAALIGDVQQVGVHGVRRLGAGLGEVHRNVGLLGVGHQGFAGGQVPV